MAIDTSIDCLETGAEQGSAVELRRSHGHLERLREALDEHAIVSTTDPAGRITYANRQFCRISKYSEVELLGQNHRIINAGYHPKSFFRDMWRTIAGGRVWRGEIKNRAKDGSFYWVAATIVPIADLNGQIVEYVSIRTDITQHREAEQRLADMYDTAHQFVDHVSHEFRTPLTVIKEFAAIIRDGLAGDTTGEQREYLEIILHRVDDLSLLVDDMLDTSKLEAGMLGINRTDCRLEEIVNEVRTTLERRAAAAGAKLEFEIPADMPTVYCDAEKTGRIILNLAINALKFCGDPGTVTLRARANPKAHEVTISITDNGPGISPENLEVLFQRFRQIEGQSRRGLKGFGLGLNIAKELTSLNFGDIHVESQLGAGSTFSFTVPFADRGPLLQRYLHRIAHLRNGATCVSLLQITAERPAGSEQCSELEHLVQHNTRRGDLLFRTASNRWLLVAAANQSDLQPLISRLEKVIANADPHHAGGSLPRVKLEHLGSWNVHSEAAAFVERFQAARGSPD